MAYYNSRPQNPEVCPICGEDVPRNAKACPGCGSDHSTGWKQDAYDGAGMTEEEEFEYDQFVKKEFGPDLKPDGISPIWWLVAVFILIALAMVGFFV